MAAPRPSIRLYVESALGPAGSVQLEPSQAHYLQTVMRLGPGAEIAVFNGRDGEWRAAVAECGRGRCTVALRERVADQTASPDLWLVFAPVKRARLDFIAAKATELGVSALWPVFTRRTAVTRINVDRLRANAIEAAEQCRRLDVPEVFEPASLDEAVAGWPSERRILMADESGAGAPVAGAMADAAPGPWAVLVGPEGGFAPDELDALAKLPFVTAVGLGPRILRSETAALAALACWQAWLGDWGRAGSGAAAQSTRVSSIRGA